jgi:hypothetical protein
MEFFHARIYTPNVENSSSNALVTSALSPVLIIAE